MAENIYQAIWDEDQKNCGVKALTPDVEITDELRANGYAVVNEKKAAGKEHRIITEVVIPENKMKSYDLVTKLFNNYTLDQTKTETSFPDEVQEVQQFMDYVHKSEPMRVAKEYAERQMQRNITFDEWWAIIDRIWFETFNMGNNRDLSGFEHVVVGEQKQGKVQGYHFWYKYYFDENFVAPKSLEETGEELDLIDFIRGKQGENDQTPDVVTLSYVWKAFDYEKKQFRHLTKPTGGFWVGISVEGLMAIGTLQFLPDVLADRRAEINGALYNLELHKNEEQRNMRTFFPKFVEMIAG